MVLADFTVIWPVGVRGKYAGKPIPAPSLNGRVDWRVAMTRSRTLRAHFGRLAELARVRLGVPPCGPERRSVTITRLMGKRQRELDLDGLYGCLKPGLDGLRDAGFVYDDKPRWLDYRADQKKAEDNVAALWFVVETV